MNDPAPPTRIVEPVVSPETAAPTPAVPCPDCIAGGNAALAKTAQGSRKGAAKPAPAPDDNDPTPQGAD